MSKRRSPDRRTKLLGCCFFVWRWLRSVNFERKRRYITHYDVFNDQHRFTELGCILLDSCLSFQPRGYRRPTRQKVHQYIIVYFFVKSAVVCGHHWAMNGEEHRNCSFFRVGSVLARSRRAPEDIFTVRDWSVVNGAHYWRWTSTELSRRDEMDDEGDYLCGSNGVLDLDRLLGSSTPLDPSSEHDSAQPSNLLR